ncbi:uncharacterized protein LOC133198017 [Saccostrea echinata]|uniref:uncharacterized protein LOC133198017 n=1 Tax=Saccostrea echinata TaxID=191078 RepID=UPI002A805621|nr:uncharacterized protein LOC133198017 [Saccostrea echinata]
MEKAISLSITCIKHESNITNDNIVHFTTQTNKSQTSQGCKESNISQPSKMEFSIKKEGNIGHVTSSPSLGDRLVAIKHMEDEQMRKQVKCQMDNTEPEMLDEEAITENTISNSENGECFERSNDFYNQIASRTNTDANPETDAEKYVKEGLTIIKLEDLMHVKTENCFDYNLNRQTTGMDNTNSMISSPTLSDGIVSIKHTAGGQKTKQGGFQMDLTLPGMLGEKEIKSENSIGESEIDECFERNKDFKNQKESRTNTVANTEGYAEKDLKERFTIIKWKEPMHDNKKENCFDDKINGQTTGMDNPNSMISLPSLGDEVVTIKHKTDEQEKRVEKYLGQMYNTQQGVLEEKGIKSENSISDSERGECFERSIVFYNQKESRENNDVNSETAVEKNLQEGFTIIKWEGCRYDKTEKDNFIKPTTGIDDTNSVNMDTNNDSNLTVVKHSSLKAKDPQIKDNGQKRLPASCILSGKQPVVVLKRLKMKGVTYNCNYSDTTGKNPCDKFSSKGKTDRREDEEIFIEASEQGMFLRHNSDTEAPSAETSSSVKEEIEDAGTDQCEFDLSQEMKDDIQSAIQTNIEAMVISNQTSNGEGFSYVYPFACGQCNYTAKLQHHLKNHMKIHSTERPFVCEICGKGFKHAHHLNGHKRTHSGERPYSCEECGRDFTQISNLLRHQKTHQGLPESPRHKCLKCDTSFSTAYSLKRHQDVHENLKEKVKTMKNHKGKKKKCTYNPRIDDTRREFECDVCGRRFRRKEHVMRHMLTHTGESAVHIYSCEVCEKKCGSKRALENHLKVHTGDDIEIHSQPSSDESDSEEEFECA